jgi:predicted transcriptional regulator
MSENAIDTDFTTLTAEVVASYVAYNAVYLNDLPNLIQIVHTALVATSNGDGEKAAERPVPAVSIKKSITPDFLICLEDGKRFKSMKRHLSQSYGLTPDAYRAKWGLPPDFPMVAPNYSAERSALAKSVGLGLNRRKAAAPEAMKAKGKPGRKKAKG